MNDEEKRPDATVGKLVVGQQSLSAELLKDSALLPLLEATRRLVFLTSVGMPVNLAAHGPIAQLVRAHP
jgi:hypothetical protein